MSKTEEKVIKENTEVVDSSEKVKKTKKKFNWKLFGNICFWVVISILGTFLALNAVDNLSGHAISTFGYRQSVIVSESMSFKNPSNTYLTDDMKQIQKFDVVLTKDYKNFEQVEQYDVVTYKLGSVLICHRVLDKYEDNGKQYIVTRGDANVQSDSPVEFSLVKGKVVKVTPKAGKAVLFFRSYYFLFALCGCIFFTALGLFIFDYSKDKKQISSETNKTRNKENKDLVVDVKPIEKDKTNENNE